jgi:hypothetical protein
MPDRFSISGSYFGQLSWDDPNAWYGGIVPTSSDRVFIRGQRTLTSGDQLPWRGKKVMFVSSSANFPSSGSLLTHIDRGRLIKLNYDFINGPTSFGGVEVDTSYWSWSLDILPVTESLPSYKGGRISNNSFIYFQPGEIVISGSLVVSASDARVFPAGLFMQNGGVLRIKDQGTLYLMGTASVGEGQFYMQDSASVVWGRNWSSSINTSNRIQDEAQTCGLFSLANASSQIIISGSEVRTNTILTTSASIGDGYLTVVDASQFEEGDHIFVGAEDIEWVREDNGVRNTYGINRGSTQFASGVMGTQFTSEDECFIVAGKDTGLNRIYLKRYTGLDSPVIATGSATEIFVDDDGRYRVGDKIVVENQFRTVITAEDSEILLREYDFTTPGGANINDWEFDVNRSLIFDDWTYIPEPDLGLCNFYQAAARYRHTFIKDLMLDKVKIEAVVRNSRSTGSNLDTSGSFAFMNQINDFGITIHSEPQQDNVDMGVWNMFNPLSTTPYGNFSRTIFGIAPNPLVNTYYVQQKFAKSMYGHWLSGSAAPVSFDRNGTKKLTLEYYKNEYKAWINDILVYEETGLRTRPMWGRVGLWSYNNSFVCTSFKVWHKCQKLTLDSPVTVSTGSKVYETGVEFPHSPNDQVIKLCSVITDLMGNKNLAFAYIGSSEYDGTSRFPLIRATNAVTNFEGNGYAAIDFRGDKHFLNVDGYFGQLNLNGRSTEIAGRSITIDLGEPTTFSRVGVSTDIRFSGSGVSFSGSNTTDTSIPFTPIIGGISRNDLAFVGANIQTFDLSGSYNYRYLRIDFGLGRRPSNTTGSIPNLNGVVVKNYTDNTIKLNNTSDLNIGDKIHIVSRAHDFPNNSIAGYGFWTSGSNGSRGGTAPTLTTSSYGYINEFVDGFSDVYTIINKSGNDITLDREFRNTFLTKDSLVYKVNRNINFYGNYGITSGSLNNMSGSYRSGRIGMHAAFTNTNRRIVLKNVAFQHVNDHTPNRGGDAVGSSNFSFGSSNFLDTNVMQGCTIFNSFSVGRSFNGVGGGGNTFRHNVICGIPNDAGSSTALFSQVSGYTAFMGSNSTYNAPVNTVGNVFSNLYGIYYGGGLNTTRFNYNVLAYTFQLTPGSPGFRDIAPTAKQYIIRNIFWYSNSTPIVVSGTNTALESHNLYEVRDNLILRSQGVISGSGWTDVPMTTRTMFARRGGLDNNTYMGNRAGTAPGVPFETTNFSFGAFNVGNPGGFFLYNEDVNRQGYDLWTSRQTMVTKKYDDPWYRFYNFETILNQSLNWQYPIMNAFISISSSVTASFTVMFDYYHSYNQVAQKQWDLNYDFSFTPVIGFGSGSLVLYATKNGAALDPQVVTYVPKTTNPSYFEKTYLLEGPGTYQIAFGQVTLGGYVAFKNIDSRFDCPNQGNRDVLMANTFHMRYFERQDLAQVRGKAVVTADPKFRLKGAKLF